MYFVGMDFCGPIFTGITYSFTELEYLRVREIAHEKLLSLLPISQSVGLILLRTYDYILIACSCSM